MALRRIDSSFDLRGYIESQIGGRAENQDAAGSFETALGTVVVVCDGMGGMNGGQTASSIAVKTIIDDVAKAQDQDLPEDVLRKAFEHAHNAIIEAAERDDSLKGMGTTATALMITSECAVAAHVGDSRIYQLRCGRKVFRTTDHSLVFQYVKQGTITEEQARLSSQSNVILKALGVGETPEPDIEVLPYLKEDRFILCTDGFWGAMPERDFVKLVGGKGYLKDVLISSAREVNMVGVNNGGGHDNLTAAMVEVLCESKIKPRMSMKQKILFAALCVLLLCSVAGNVLAVREINQIKTEQAKSEDSAPQAAEEETTIQSNPDAGADSTAVESVNIEK